MHRCTMLCSAVLCCAAVCCTKHLRALPFCAVQLCAEPCRAVSWRATPCSASRTVQSPALSGSTILCSATVCVAVQCSYVLWHAELRRNEQRRVALCCAAHTLQRAVLCRAQVCTCLAVHKRAQCHAAPCSTTATPTAQHITHTREEYDPKSFSPYCTSHTREENRPIVILTLLCCSLPQ